MPISTTTPIIREYDPSTGKYTYINTKTGNPMPGYQPGPNDNIPTQTTNPATGNPAPFTPPAAGTPGATPNNINMNPPPHSPNIPPPPPNAPNAPPQTGGTPVPQPTGAQPSDNSPAGMFQSAFANTPYYNTSGFQQVLQGFLGTPGALPSAQAAQNWTNVLQGYANTFASQFQNYVGRAPTADEYNQFFTQVVAPLNEWNPGVASNGQQIAAYNATLQQQLPGFLNQNFANAKQAYNTQQLTNAAQTATAPGSAFDQWQQAYSQSVNNIQSQLQQYQQQLFQKLQPNLITSLAAKGLLNTGALNTAFAGAAEDLGNTASQYVAGLQGQDAQDVAQQKFNLLNAPNVSAITNWSGVIPNMTNTGNSALQGAYNNEISANMANLSSQYQTGLLNTQYANQPNPLSQYGGLLLGGLSSGVGQGLANPNLWKGLAA